MLHTLNIGVHILGGLLAMMVGVVAYTTAKGGKRHIQVGRLFLGLMAVVIVTAMNGVLFFIDQPFLAVVTLLSFYCSYTGFRVLRTKQGPRGWLDILAMLLVLGVAFDFWWRMTNLRVVWHAGVVEYLLLYVVVIVGFDLLRVLFPKWITHPRLWLYEHIYKMTSAFTALISAGVGTVFASWAPYHQIVPAIGGTIWLIACLWYFSKKIKSITLG